MKKISDVLLKIVKCLCATMFAIMIVSIFAQFIARYVFNSGFKWTEELARYCCIWMTFLGAIIAVEGDNHPAITVFADAMPLKVQKLNKIIVHILMIMFSSVITWRGVALVRMTINDLSPGLCAPLGLVYSSLPFSTLVIAIYIIFKLINECKGFCKKSKEGDQIC